MPISSVWESHAGTACTDVAIAGIISALGTFGTTNGDGDGLIRAYSALVSTNPMYPWHPPLCPCLRCLYLRVTQSWVSLAIHALVI